MFLKSTFHNGIDKQLFLYRHYLNTVNGKSSLVYSADLCRGRVRVSRHRHRSDWNSGGTHGKTYYKSPAVEAKKHIFLHRNASNLVLKIFQHDKIWEDNPPAPNSGGTCPPLVPSVIYAHVSRVRGVIDRYAM